MTRTILGAVHRNLLRSRTQHMDPLVPWRKVFLTMLGGGAFGNPTRWIVDALERSLNLYADTALEVMLVSYGAPESAIQHLLR